MKKENLTKFYSNYRAQIFPVVVALASLFLIVFVIYPQTAKLISNQKTMDDLTNKSKFLETKVTALEGYDQEDLSRKVEYVMAAYPSDKDFGNVLSILQQLTAQSGFIINAISFNSSAAIGGVDSFEVKLEIRGVKIMFQTLLNNLENYPRLIKIKSMDISSNQTDQALGASLTIEVLFAPVPQNFGSADSPLPNLSQKDEELISTISKASTVVLSPENIQLIPRGKSNPFD